MAPTGGGIKVIEGLRARGNFGSSVYEDGCPRLCEEIHKAVSRHENITANTKTCYAKKSTIFISRSFKNKAIDKMYYMRIVKLVDSQSFKSQPIDHAVYLGNPCHSCSLEHVKLNCTGFTSRMEIDPKVLSRQGDLCIVNNY
ncbi:hypothetical protein Tco_1280024 [Tanacetum coccineum]